MEGAPCGPGLVWRLGRALRAAPLKQGSAGDPAEVQGDDGSGGSPGVIGAVEGVPSDDDEPVLLLADIGLEGPGEAATVRTHKTFLWQ